LQEKNKVMKKQLQFLLLVTCLLCTRQASQAQDSLAYYNRKYTLKNEVTVEYVDLDISKPVYKAIDATIKDSMRKYVNEFIVFRKYEDRPIGNPDIPEHSQRKGNSDWNWWYYSHIGIKIVSNTPRYLSTVIQINALQSSGSGRGFENIRTLNFKIEGDTFKQLTLDDVVKDRQQLVKSFWKEFVKQGREQAEADFYIKQGFAQYMRIFSVGKEGLTIYIEPYTFERDSYEVTISWQELGNNAKIKFE
jgi:hypothetical protein